MFAGWFWENLVLFGCNWDWDIHSDFIDNDNIDIDDWKRMDMYIYIDDICVNWCVFVIINVFLHVFVRVIYYEW